MRANVDFSTLAFLVETAYVASDKLRKNHRFLREIIK
jgi:hypothetical protein